MSEQEPQSGWEALMEEASQELMTWRQQHSRARFTEIEEEVDEKLARVRKQIFYRIWQWRVREQTLRGRQRRNGRVVRVVEQSCGAKESRGGD